MSHLTSLAPLYDAVQHTEPLLLLHPRPISAEAWVVAHHALSGRACTVARVRGSQPRDLYPAIWRALLPYFPTASWSDLRLELAPDYNYSLPDDLRLAHKVLYQSALWADRDGDEAATARMEGARGWLTGTRAGNKHARRAYHIEPAIDSLPPHHQAQLAGHALHWRQRLTGQHLTLVINLQDHHRCAANTWRNEWMRAVCDRATSPAPVLIIATPEPSWQDDVWSRLLTRKVRMPGGEHER